MGAQCPHPFLTDQRLSKLGDVVDGQLSFSFGCPGLLPNDIECLFDVALSDQIFDDRTNYFCPTLKFWFTKSFHPYSCCVRTILTSIPPSTRPDDKLLHMISFLLWFNPDLDSFSRFRDCNFNCILHDEDDTIISKSCVRMTWIDEIGSWRSYRKSFDFRNFEACHINRPRDDVADRKIFIWCNIHRTSLSVTNMTISLYWFGFLNWISSIFAASITILHGTSTDSSEGFLPVHNW